MLMEIARNTGCGDGSAGLAVCAVDVDLSRHVRWSELLTDTVEEHGEESQDAELKDDYVT